jgi:hypothetical protein
VGEWVRGCVGGWMDGGGDCQVVSGVGWW